MDGACARMRDKEGRISGRDFRAGRIHIEGAGSARDLRGGPWGRALGGPGMVQGWSRDGPRMVQGWSRDGPGMVHGRSMDGPGMAHNNNDKPQTLNLKP